MGSCDVIIKSAADLHKILHREDMHLEYFITVMQAGACSKEIWWVGTCSPRSTTLCLVTCVCGCRVCVLCVHVFGQLNSIRVQIDGKCPLIMCVQDQIVSGILSLQSIKLVNNGLKKFEGHF